MNNFYVCFADEDNVILDHCIIAAEFDLDACRAALNSFRSRPSSFDLCSQAACIKLAPEGFSIPIDFNGARIRCGLLGGVVFGTDSFDNWRPI